MSDSESQLSKNRHYSHPSGSEPRSKVDEIWDQMQEELKGLSTRSRRIIAKDSGHYIQVEGSDLLNTEVTNFVRQLPGEAPPSLDYGTTETE
jgi:hypothetical protein